MSAFSSDAWQELGPYLDQALTLSREQRASWLAALQEQNVELAARLGTLLEEYDALECEGFLEQPPEACAGHTMLTGRTIGSYSLISQIGHGGMGSVWLAERNDGRFERRAAVKFLNIALAGRGEERFRREGTILGGLVHPNIAQLLDAGLSDAGQPYLILEYVDGEHIDEYCDHFKLDVDARIRLFLDVLTAVSHAHANLVVHRDLKPSNVLVTAERRVKLLDFGIAKLLEEQGAAAGATQLTREGGAALTPYYAAPEQVTDRPVTTATDVYSLGVLLYLLLTGQHPAGAGPHSPAELIKAIVETEPPLASAVVASGRAGAKTQVANASNRGTTPEKLSGRLRGDLDTIMTKALKKNLEERYSAAAELADDLQRYLRHEPIRARVDTLAYRTLKFVRRYPVPVATATMTIAGLVIGLAVLTRERNLAETRYRDVREIAQELFKVERDVSGFPGATAARERIVKTSLRYLEDLSKGAGNDVALKTEIATGYRQVADVQGVFRSTNLGHPEDARASLGKAEALFHEISRARPRDPQPLRDLISTLDMESRIDFGALNFASLDRRISELESLLALYEPRAPQDEANWTFLASTYDSMATSGGLMSHLDQAVTFALRSTEYRRKVAAQAKTIRARGNLANSLGTYGSISRKAGRVKQAEGAYRECIALLEGILVEQPDSYPARLNLANSLTSLAKVHGDMDGPNLGRQADAIAMIERSVQIGREVMAADHREALVRYNHAVANLYLGRMLQNQDPRRAIQAYDEAIAVVTPPGQDNLPKVVLSLALSESSFSLREVHRESEARQRLQQASAIAENLRKTAPSASVECDEAISRAEADWSLAEGHPLKAVELHRTFIAETEALRPPPLDPAQSMMDAFTMVQRYRLLAKALTSAAREAEAAQAQDRRNEIIALWKRKLPDDPLLESLIAH